jgi:hypothetical protein
MFAIGFLMFCIAAFAGWANLVNMNTKPNTWSQFFVALGVFVGAGLIVLSVVIKAWEMMP